MIEAPTTPPAAAAVPKDDVAALFRAEQQQRRDDGMRVEDVLAAFKTAGVQVSNVRQHLAKPFGADYCAGADAGHDVVMSICEFRSAQAAAAGRMVSLKGLASIPHRRVDANGATTLTLRERQSTPASQALVSTLERAFSNLKK